MKYIILRVLVGIILTTLVTVSFVYMDYYRYENILEALSLFFIFGLLSLPWSLLIFIFSLFVPYDFQYIHEHIPCGGQEGWLRFIDLFWLPVSTGIFINGFSASAYLIYKSKKSSINLKMMKFLMNDINRHSSFKLRI